MPIYAYQFDDDSAPQRYTPPGLLPRVATHVSEIQYLFDLPSAPVRGDRSTPTQRKLSDTMRAAWANFRAPT